MTDHDSTPIPAPQTLAPQEPPPQEPPASDRAVRRRLRHMGFTLTATDTTAGPALNSARHHLARALAAGPVAPGMPATGKVELESLAESALAALALGDYEVAAEVGRLLGQQQVTRPELTPSYLLLLARHLAWTGAIHFLRDEWPRIISALDRRPLAADHPAAARWRGILEELTLAAESIGEKAAAEDLRAESKAMAGVAGAGPDSAAAPPGSATAAPGSAGPPTSGPVAPEPRLAPGAGAAAVVDYYLRGILGVEPDAPQNRLVMRPRLPEEWTEMTVERLRFSDAEVGLRYRRQGNWHRFTFEQESGPVPVRVIFEPMLPAPSLAAAVVDGQTAQLYPRPLGGRLRVPVQIVLDDTRVVELEAGQEEERRRTILPVR